MPIAIDQNPIAAQDAVSFAAMSPQAAGVIRQHATSRSQRKIQEEIRKLRMRLQVEQHLARATVVNFNPLPLVQEGQVRLTIPESGASGHHRVVVRYGERDFVGHAVTIDNPIIYAAVTGVEMDTTTGIDAPQQTAKYIPPIGIAYSFWERYGAIGPGSSQMGGVLIFEGDRHVLDANKLLSNDGMVRVPEPVGLDHGERTFRSQPQDLGYIVEGIFAMQAEYAGMRFDNANQIYATQDPEQQRSITNVDRIWARFMLSHGLIETLPTWVEKNFLSSAQLAKVVRCPLCSSPQPNEAVLLCPKDQAPFDAYVAFMAGMPVADQWIDALPDEQLDLVMAERVRRERRSADALERARKMADAPAPEMPAGEAARKGKG